VIEYSYQRATLTPDRYRYNCSNRSQARRGILGRGTVALTDDAVACMTDPDGIRVVADVLFELESNRLRRPVDVALFRGSTPVSPASGNVASLVNGNRVSTPTDPPVTFPPGGGVPIVELTWDDPRQVNVVEVHGDEANGQPTLVIVATLNDVGVWQTKGAAQSDGGRLYLILQTYDAPVTCYGVRVTIQGHETPATYPIVEIDPMYVLDVTDQVISIEGELARESSPSEADTPFGNYQASTLSLTLDNTSGFWSPATNRSLDVGHRVEVAFGVTYFGALVDGGGISYPQTIDELVPAGVFYTDPFGVDSASVEVNITASDRLGRYSGTQLAETVLVDIAVEDLVAALARDYLDLDGDQVVVGSSIAGTVFPYAYPTGTLGTYLADVAKALGATLYVDALDRLVLARQADVADTVIATVADDVSLISFRKPPGYDLTTSSVTVTGAPLVEDVEAELWAMPSGGITVPIGQSHTLICPYSNVPAVDGRLDGLVTDVANTVTSSSFYADRAEIVIRNDAATVLTVADARVLAKPLIEGALTVRREHQPSIDRYGPRNLEIVAGLAQDQATIEFLADVLLDTFRSLADDGTTRAPDVSFDSLGLLHLEPGDRVTVTDSERGLGGDYVILGRRIGYADGAILLSDVRAREAPTSAVAVADSGDLTDDARTAG
jgi:hypothetical protein